MKKSKAIYVCILNKEENVEGWKRRCDERYY